MNSILNFLAMPFPEILVTRDLVQTNREQGAYWFSLVEAQENSGETSR